MYAREALELFWDLGTDISMIHLHNSAILSVDIVELHVATY